MPNAVPGAGKQDDHPSSSFPTSSPTFWNEAAKLVAPDNELSTTIPGQKGEGHSAKRRKLRSSPESPSLPLVAKPEPLYEVPKPYEEDRSGTTLSYLPNRSDPFADMAAHTYLTGAEYAPNKFGDIGDYMRKKEIKVQTQNREIAMADPAAAGLPQIFRDLSFYINGNTQPPMEELRKMILQRGGEVRPVLRSKGMVKYIIAPMLTQMKFKQFVNYKVVREAWILESCKAGKLLDWTRWKLTVQGGWEEDGRKGLEGFFKGEPTQRPKREREGESGNEEEEAIEPSTKRPNVDRAAAIASVAIKPVDSTISTSPERVKRTTDESVSNNFMAQPESASRVETKPDPPLSTPGKPRPTPLPSVKPLIAPSLGQSPIKSPVSRKTETTPRKSEGSWEFYASKESNEDAARLLKDQEWRLKNTAERGNEGGFIDGYYQNSRLHHLSTWKTELRVLVAAAQRQSEENSLKAPSTSTISHLSLAQSVLPTRAQPTGSTGQKMIFHVDFDCFFVSCGLATRPHLRGKPSVVCHSTGGTRMEGSTSEIASASYEARAKGVKNGMSLGRARTLVGEELQTIPYEFETYKKFSLAFYTVLMGYADELQAVSVDEALIDVTSAVAAREAAPEEADEEGVAEGMVEADGLVDEEGMDLLAERPPLKPRDAAVEIAQKIRDDIRRETGCEVSIGISHNVLLSKLATRRAKPAGVYHLTTVEIPTFLAPLDVDDFPSVGYSIKSKIEEKFGTTIAGELMDHPKGAFRGLLGPKTGEMVWGYLRGIDERKLEPHKERKSISAEMNYGIRFRNDEQAEICVRDLAAEVAKRMKQVNAKGRLLTLKIMKRHPEAPVEPPKFLGHGWCETFNKSSSVGTKGGASTDDPEILGVEAVKLLRTLGLDPVELRGVGIQMTKLDGEKAEREAGQAVLSFGTSGTKGKAAAKDEQMEEEREEWAGNLAEAEMEETPAVQPLAQLSEPAQKRQPQLNASAGPSRLAAAASSDGIDPDFLAALPADLQREVREEHARTRAAKKSVVPALGSSSANTSKPAIPAPAEAASRLAPGKVTSHPPTRLKDTVGSTVPFWSKLDHTINKDGRHSAAHITKQLRPKMKTQLKAGQIADLALYSAWSKAGKGDGSGGGMEARERKRSASRGRTPATEVVDVVDMTISPKGKGKEKEKDRTRRESTGASTPALPPVKAVEMIDISDEDDKPDADPSVKIGLYLVKDLVELGIDPSFFAELPLDMQKEIITEERRKQRQRLALHRPADTSRIRAKEREADKSKGIGQDRNVSTSPRGSRAGSVPIIARPAIVRPESRRPSMLNATKLPDVLDTITKWVESRGRKGPAERDAKKVEGYLVRLMEPGVGVGGVEAAIECLKWMKVILGEKWKDEKGGEDVDEYMVLEKDRMAGREWWDTWRGFVGSVSKRCEETMGAPLRL